MYLGLNNLQWLIFHKTKPNQKLDMAQSNGAAEYTDCISAEEYGEASVMLDGFVWFLCLMAYQLFLGYLMPKPFS